MKNSVFNNNRKNNGKLDTAKSVAKSFGEGLGYVALTGLVVLGAYAEAENENRREQEARNTLISLETELDDLRDEINSISLSKFPWGYYNGILNDLNDIDRKYMNVKRIILRHGLSQKTIDEINSSYGYFYISSIKNSISYLRNRIR